MKTSDMKRIRAIKILLVALIIVFSVATFTACNLFSKNDVTSIEVDESSLEGYYAVDGFDITSIKLIVTYSDGKTNVINAQNSMLTTEAKDSLKTAGEKNITLTYKKQTTTLTVVLVEDGSTIVAVTFRDAAGNELGKKFAIAGNAVEEFTAPTVEGQVFSGWVDASGNKVDLSKVSASITVTAQYTVKKDTYTLTFLDYKGNVLRSSSVAAGTSITASQAPSVNFPEVKKSGWSAKFPITVESDISVKMVVEEYNSAVVLFEYAFENNPAATTRLSAETVIYGNSVAGSKTAAEKSLRDLGYEIAETPTENTTITKTGTVVFKYIVKMASVGVVVYRDAEKTVRIDYSSPVKIGSVLTLPTADVAASVQNKVLSGWLISGSKGNVTVDSADGKWTVTGNLGNDVVITPVYSDITVAVAFEFVFSDVQIPNMANADYKLTLNVNDVFKLNDSVSYTFMSNLLTNIIDNKNDYVSILGGRTINNDAVYSATDNGSSVRNSALEKIADYKIIIAKCGEDVIAPGGFKVVSKTGMSFTITISKATAGIIYDEVTEENEVIGLIVTGLGSAYVENTNIFIPDRYNGKPVIGITANAFADGEYKITGIPSGLISIGNDAFKGSVIFGSVTLNDLNTLGAEAFYGATVVGGNISFEILENIPDNAFYGIKGKTESGENAEMSISLPKVTTVGEKAFYGATGLKTVTFGDVTEIGASAFETSSSVDTINGLTKLSTLGEKAFKGTSLSGIDLPAITSIGNDAFADMEELIEVSIATAVEAEDAFELNIDVFAGSTNIWEIKIGSGISEVNGTIFESFTELVSVIAQNSSFFYSDKGVLYKKVGENQYVTAYYPNNLTGSYKAALPSGASLTVYAEAFDNATIAVLDFSEVTVSDVADQAVGGTANSVYSVIIGEGSTLKTAFEEVFVGANVVGKASEAVFGYDVADKLVYELVKVTVNGRETTTVTIVGGYSKAKSITVPAKIAGYDVTKVADEAFADFEKLEDLTINATLESWNASIIAGDYALVRFSVAGWSRDYEPVIADFEDNGWFNTNNVISIGGIAVGYNNAAILNGLPRTTVSAEEAGSYFPEGIPEEFFMGSNLTEIRLPASVTVIGAKAFKNCSALKVFEAEELTFVGDEAFAFVWEGNERINQNEELEEIVLNFTGSASFMGENVFLNDNAITSVTINGMVNRNVLNGVAYYYLPSGTFSGCTKLAEVNLEYINGFGVNNSGESKAFYNCIALKKFDMSKIITEEVPAYAFANSAIQYAIFTSSSVKTIGEQAFNNCGQLKYVKFGANVVNVEDDAFTGCNNLIVELSYDNGGFYSANAEVSDDAFEDSVVYYISQSTITSSEAVNAFLTGKTWTNNYPSVSLQLTNKTERSITFDMMAINNKLMLLEEDLVAPTYDGYTFAGWYKDSDENADVEFPLMTVETRNNAIVTITQLYAKYYNASQGSLSTANDMKYVYYIGTLPEVDLDADETAEWLCKKNDNTYINIQSLPFVEEIDVRDVMTVVLNIKKGGDVIYTQEFEDVGCAGYAIKYYEGRNADRIVIPESGLFSMNGVTAPIIVVYAGAFNNVVPKEFTLPAYTKALLLGGNYYNEQESGYSFGNELGFNQNLTKIVIPASLEYIGDGVLTGENVEEIVFEEGSNLIYATEDAFIGSTWWKNQLVKAIDNKGFIMAGRLAVKFIGTADTMLLPEGTDRYVTTTAKDFGFRETEDEITLKFKIYYEDGTSESVEVALTSDTTQADGVYVYTFDISAPFVLRGTFALNTATSPYTYKYGENLLILENGGYPANAIALAITSDKDSIVTVPTGTIKLNDSIFKGNAELNTLIINKEMIYIGNNAFKDSGLSAIRYGLTNSDQFVSAIAYVGKDAFTGTTWYGRETVILGTLFLKYNNVSGATSITITESISKIVSGAFKDSTLTSVDIRSTTLKEIGAFAFKSSNLRTIILPAGIVKIGRGAFAFSRYLGSADLSLTSITELSPSMFEGAENLTTVKLPITTVELGANVFKNCLKLASITADGVQSLEVMNGEFTSGLNYTLWYDKALANSAALESDTVLRLGKVLVKYIVGVNSANLFNEEKAANGEGALTITVPDGIETISYKAFAVMEGEAETSKLDLVTELIIPDSVKVIGDYAFTGLVGLQSVTLGSGLTVIGEKAFMGLEKLKTATLPDGLKKIGSYAFSGTSITTEVLDDDGIRIEDEGYVIPDSVESIGSYAFYGVDTLTYLKLGSKITELGMHAFDVTENVDKGKLYKVDWDLDINEIKDENGLKKSDSPLILLATYMNGVDGLNLNEVFKTSSDLSIRFYVSETVKDHIESSVSAALARWESWSFFKAGSLPQINFDNNGYSLSPINTEYLVEGDIEIPPHETESGNTYTFMYWTVGTSNTRLTYPYIVTEDVEFKAVFYANTIRAEDSSKTETDKNDVRFNYVRDGNTAKITSITGADKSTVYIPDKISYADSGQAAVGYKVNEFDTSIREESVKTLILTNAANFNGMTENIFRIFPNLEKIELYLAGSEKADYKVVPTELTAKSGTKEYKSTFYVIYSNDTSATSLYGSKLIAVIGNVATASKEHLGESSTEKLNFIFNIPEGVKEIYSEAMVNNGFITVSLPSSVNAIGSNAFGTSLAALRIPKKNNSANISLVSVDYNSINTAAPIMQTLAGSQDTQDTYIELKGLRYKYSNYGYFYAVANVLVGYVSNVREYLGAGNGLVLPSSVNGVDITVISSKIYRGYNTSLGFVDASNDVDLTTDEITLPSKLQIITAEAFKFMNFTSVINAENYTNLREVANNVFDGTDFYEENTSANGLYIGKVLIKWTTAKEGQSEIKGDTVAISSNAFRGSSITSIEIPGTVVSIGANAFYGCTDLVSVTISNNVAVIGDQAFMACNSLRIVNIDTENSGLSTIGNKAFANDTALTVIHLPYSVSEIGKGAFSGCSSLTTVTFDGYADVNDETSITHESNLKVLGEQAFLNDMNLTAIKIPAGLEIINVQTFENCKELRKLTFADGSKLNTIASKAFSGCTYLGSEIDINNPSLLTIILPESLVTVENLAFNACEKLFGVRFGHNIDKLGDNVFAGCVNLAKVEILRATPPTISSNTFGTLNTTENNGTVNYGTLSTNNYRLRIYVQPDDSGAFRNAYIAKWGEGWTEYIYEKGDLPKLIFRASEDENAETFEIRTDIIVNPTHSFYANEISSWLYYSFKQGNTTYSGGQGHISGSARLEITGNAKVNVASYNGQQVNINGNNYTFLVVDYDEMVIIPATATE